MRLDLEPCIFLRRYKRFLADVRLPDGRIETVHCANSGSMRTLLNPDVPARLVRSASPSRKLPATLTLLGLPRRRWAVVDTMLPNRLIAEAIREDRIAALAGADEVQAEATSPGGTSRFDFRLRHGSRSTWVEVKSVTMLGDEPGLAAFPDAVTTRGTKHLRELTDLVRAGTRCVQVYLVTRTDCDRCTIAAGIDPTYAGALGDARSVGVEVLALGLVVRGSTVTVGDPVDFLPP